MNNGRNNDPIQVLHVITGLELGGAEMMLYKLITGMNSNEFKNDVVSLTGIGPIGRRLEEAGVSVKAVNINKNPFNLKKLIGWLRNSDYRVVQTWMYHADLLGGLTAKISGTPIVWNIRRSSLKTPAMKRTTILIAKACAVLSGRLPAKIVCCSETARITHIHFGYAGDKITVIPNGFDLDLYKPDLQARNSIRQELGIDENTLLIGMVGRYHPVKDHKTFITSAKILHGRLPRVHFLLCGNGITWDNHQLVRLIEPGVRDRFHLLGPLQDISRIYPAMDIACSSSITEGFPNVVGEAMSCSIPCVVTDVGDSAYLVDDTGRIVPPRDPNALAGALQEVIESGEQGMLEMGKAARRRIEKHFSLPSVVSLYQKIYASLAADSSWEV